MMTLVGKKVKREKQRKEKLKKETCKRMLVLEILFDRHIDVSKRSAGFSCNVSLIW